MKKRSERRQHKQGSLAQYVIGVLTGVTVGVILILIQKLFQL
ncbi:MULTISPECIES: hypothetical protein [Paenibacillus]|nr:hypothetical protein [Paenibacillus cucumis (ex Kampfer et al. 2016)]MDP9699136.1 tetrahydromethanopterin S-methyltransferase subunit G [Paenibacillus intestini]